MGPAEVGYRLVEPVRRALGASTGRLQSLPILALTVHSACNCRCVMCDIWTANAEGREIDLATLDRQLAAMRRLRVRRVMLTGGEPLLHRNLWALCDRLRADGIAVTLVTTGLLIGRHAADVARCCDEVVVSIDGPPPVHDAIRRVPGGHARIATSLDLLAGRPGTRRVIARSVVQRLNCAVVDETVAATLRLAVDRVSFLPVDLATPAFNREQPWDASRRAEVAIGPDEVPLLHAAIERTVRDHATALAHGFVEGGQAALWRIEHHARASLGLSEAPLVRCNAPWVSAVLEVDGRVRPCFFHPPYAVPAGGSLEAMVNAPSAVAFRRQLDVRRDPICRACVCSKYLAPHQTP
jgi:MoaA/NifB/PqqE/SkfB family radical SAM enzyme